MTLTTFKENIPELNQSINQKINQIIELNLYDASYVAWNKAIKQRKKN